jgi:hypothetical protein
VTPIVLLLLLNNEGWIQVLSKGKLFLLHM